MNIMRIIFCLVLFSCLGTRVKALDLEIKEAAGTIQILSLADTLFENSLYVSSELLEHLFKNTGEPVPDRQKYIIPDEKGRSWYLTIDNPYVLVGEKVYNLVYPVRRGANYIYLPLQQTLSILRKEYSFNIVYDSAKNSLLYNPSTDKAPVLASGKGNILSVSKSDLVNGSMVEIQLTETLTFNTLWVPPHFIVTISRGILNPELLNPQKWKGLVRSISTTQEDSLAQITLYLPAQVDTVEADFSEADRKISLLVRKAIKEKGKSSKQKKAEPAKKTIILDPGHGGSDPGAIFKNAREKHITLAVGKILKSLLQKGGFKVIMTREKDAFIPLQDRPKFASEKGGDLFISLHCNAISGTPKKLKTIEGFVAYILRAGESEEDKALARRENQAVKLSKHKQNKTEISPVEWILLEHELNLYSHQSEKLAEVIVKAFEGGRIKKHRTGAHQAGFFVLVGTFMPAVLFEMGFITNEKDRRYISTAKGQKDVAKRMASAITDFFKQH
jgi:N-acetylmuramoyl-L-alanine amidase